MRTSAPAATAEESREAPLNSHGDWTFLRPDERVPEVHVLTREEPQFPAATREKAGDSPLNARPFSPVASREKSHLPSASKGSLTPLKQLKKFPDIPASTRVEHRSSHHNCRRAPFFPPHLEKRVYFSGSSGKKSRHFRRTSRGDSLNLTLESNSWVLASIPKGPDVPIDSRYT